MSFDLGVKRDEIVPPPLDVVIPPDVLYPEPKQEDLLDMDLVRKLIEWPASVGSTHRQRTAIDGYTHPILFDPSILDPPSAIPAGTASERSTPCRIEGLSFSSSMVERLTDTATEITKPGYSETKSITESMVTDIVKKREKERERLREEELRPRTREEIKQQVEEWRKTRESQTTYSVDGLGLVETTSGEVHLAPVKRSSYQDCMRKPFPSSTPEVTGGAPGDFEDQSCFLMDTSFDTSPILTPRVNCVSIDKRAVFNKEFLVEEVAKGTILLNPFVLDRRIN